MDDKRYSVVAEQIYDAEQGKFLPIRDVCERLNLYESNLDSLLGFLKEVYDGLCEEEEKDDVYRDGQALFHTPDGRTFTDAREADKHIQQLWKQEED